MSRSEPVTDTSFHVVWHQKLAAAARGIALARETLDTLAWDERGWLYLFNQAGVRQSQILVKGDLVSAACAEDSSSHAVITRQGELSLLAPDLRPRWRQTLPAPLLAVALDTFGQYVAAADQSGGVHLFDVRGKPVTKLDSPRPLSHLAFVPAAPVIIGSADYGLVNAFNLGGEWLWRDGLVARVGDLAVSGDGAQVLLACFSEGLRRYDGNGKAGAALSVEEPSRLVSQSYDGGTILVAGLSTQSWLVDRAGTMKGNLRANAPIVDLALAPRADAVRLALADGSISCVPIK
jgi:hypothetical protein